MSDAPENTAAPNSDSAQNRRLGWLKDLLSILALPAVVFLLFTFILGIGMVSGTSMAPLYDDCTMVITSRLTSPKCQDIVMVRSSALGEEIIKRVIGLPGDRVEVRDGMAYRNGEALDEPYVAYPGGPDQTELVVPEHTIFVLGDNRQVSLDSRNPMLGLVPEKEVDGTVLASFQVPAPLADFVKRLNGQG